MHQESEVGPKIEKNKFESSISELKKKTFVSAADIESYGKSYSFVYLDAAIRLQGCTGSIESSVAL